MVSYFFLHEKFEEIGIIASFPNDLSQTVLNGSNRVDMVVYFYVLKRTIKSFSRGDTGHSLL